MESGVDKYKIVTLNLILMENQNMTGMAGYHQWQKCIEACLRCAALCDHCASSCLREEDVKMMARCIQLDMECAAMCYTAAKLMSLGSAKAKDLCRLCAEMCRECGNECGRHEHMKHCQECAEACHACADECARMQESYL